MIAHRNSTQTLREISRRPSLVMLAILAGRALRVGVLGWVLGSAAWAGPGFDASIAQVETRMQGRIGVFAMRGAETLGHRAGERFAYCSTFKWVLGASVLKRVESGELDLGHLLSYTEKDLISTSPVTSAHVREGHMSVGDLCAATITTSDNTAANLLEPLVGGPSGLQAFVRSLGDPVMRFDRMEPELNSNLPGDPRDTTTPEAMARLLQRVMETDALTKGSRDRLLAWMEATTTGRNRIRAGIPQGWTVGDKTGTSNNGAVNDVAIILPPKGVPIYLCVFTDGDRTDGKAHEAAIAEVAKLVLEALH